jgi:hypothetical protein
MNRTGASSLGFSASGIGIAGNKAHTGRRSGSDHVAAPLV